MTDSCRVLHINSHATSNTVADGLVTGNGEDMSTPEHLANILGFDIDEFEDDTFEYDCIGVIHTKNRARVYHGILQKGHKFLKYISIVKCGLPEEATTTAKPGNRGKRDSQLIVMGYYNRIHYGREVSRGWFADDGGMDEMRPSMI